MKRAALLSALLTVVVGAALGAQQAAPPTQTPPQTAAGQAPRRDAGGDRCDRNPYNCIDAPNPLPLPNTVWLEEMTWMDVRDNMKAGKTTVIISTGGMEPNGPWLALGKHNYVLRANCDAIARKLGNAMCAPIVPFVPEGNYETRSGHMATVGTISLTEATFAALLTDIVRSYKAHGFENIMMIGDSGGNGRGMTAVAKTLMTEWGGKPLVAHIPEHYQYNTVSALLNELGVTKPGMVSDNLHDDPGITMNMFVTDPQSVRWEARVKAGKATINGVDISDKAKTLEIGKKIVEMRATNTAAAIRKAIDANRK